jgi:hypothetical protein
MVLSYTKTNTNEKKMLVDTYDYVKTSIFFLYKYNRFKVFKYLALLLISSHLLRL